MAVPYTFGTATSSIPLSQLDSNFATAITLGNTAIQLGNTATTLNNMTLANVTIASGNVTLTNVAVTTANVTTANITTAVIVNDNVTNLVATSANVTTANVTTANITTANITNSTVSGSETLSGGTANGVAYLNGSKVVTTGSALTFDGTNLSNTGRFIVNNAGSAAGISDISLGSLSGGAWLNTPSGTTGYLAVAGTGAYSWTSTVHTWLISGSEQMRLTSTGLGIGTSSPSAKLHISSSTDTKFRTDSGATNSPYAVFVNTTVTTVGTENSSGGNLVAGSSAYATVLSNNGAYPLQLGTNNTVRATIDSSGNLGLGVTPSAWDSSVLTAFQVRSASISAVPSGANDAYFTSNGFYNASWKYINNGYATQYRQGAGTGQHQWLNAPSGTAGNAISFTQAMTLDANGNLGVGTTSPSSRLNVVSGTATGAAFGSNQYIRLDGSNGASYTAAVASTGNLTSGYYFSTSNAYEAGVDYEGTSRFMTFRTANTERARIDSSGNLLVGTTSVPTAGQGGTSIGLNSGNGLIRISANGTGTTGLVNFNNPNGNVGYIATTGSVTAYVTASDKRLKENIVDAPEFGSIIDSIQVRSYNWKIDGEHQRAGFIAQELVAVAPEAVHQPANPEEMMGVDYSKLVPMLVKEIQDLRKRVAALEPTGFVQSFLP